MFSFNMFEPHVGRVFQNRFSTQYRCYSVSMLAGPNDRSDVEKGGKIIMPPSALDQLSRLNITYPMLFKLTNKNSDRMTHCGVLEFVADEGICYLPHWMMQNLLLEEGGLVQVESVNLMVATYSKFQPQSPDFLDITNPKAVLENALRNFACLTTGDVIAINYNEKIYELRVMETKPDKAVSIIECDMNVDFDAPLGYKEPERHMQHPEEPTEEETDPSNYEMDLGFRAFTGSGNRLDGKKKGIEPSPVPIDPSDIKRGIPNYEYKIGRITFIRNARQQPRKIDTDESASNFIAFSGEGKSLRKKGRNP
ncbi:ubiquitin recognition factor in ER-associated degradation protein 1-like isoform X1 [Myxocyprinus asiaticus]|uniref:ubiquitin recognition factor in ER-associated degradation protein 1-like isoform X1 n=2 Tax=Myxocyprinus asiaticus TaxID=70543 RepID=UPI002222C10D|nr:ubiquitin recognition factor in ER-associated degradation protein 1-like isoform X1 [Myxocyprinus asiaticus]